MTGRSAQPRLPSIARLNAFAPTAFSEALRPLFEAAGSFADVLWAERPFASYADLLERAEAAAASLSTQAQIELVSAHPRIGESADVVKQQSALSYREQGYDQEASLPPDELQHVYEALAELNRAYEQLFGFRFVVFVNGRSKSEILEVLRARLQRPPAEELRTCLQAMFSIARDRLSALTIDE